MQQLHVLPYSLLGGGGLQLVQGSQGLFLLQAPPHQQGLAPLLPGGQLLAASSGGGGGLPLELLVKGMGGPGAVQQVVVLPQPAQPTQPLLSVLPLDATLQQPAPALQQPARAAPQPPPREPAPLAPAQGKRPRPMTPDTYRGHAAKPLAHPSGSRSSGRVGGEGVQEANAASTRASGPVDDEEEERCLQKREKNKMAQRRYRDRRRTLLSELEDMTTDLEEKLVATDKELKRLREENQHLTTQLSRLDSDEDRRFPAQQQQQQQQHQPQPQRQGQQAVDLREPHPDHLRGEPAPGQAVVKHEAGAALVGLPLATQQALAELVELAGQDGHTADLVSKAVAQLLASSMRPDTAAWDS